jgi:hypothetical protein
MLEKFFRCEFNIFEFRRNHETELRDLAITQYAKTASPEELAQDVDDMFRLHKMTKKIKIDQGFPQKKLVETMRPFLRVYLLERFSFSTMTRKYSSRQLNIMLNQFAEKNPNYGRRSMLQPNKTTTTQECIKNEPKYVTEALPHNSYCKSNYMETHIYDEDTFDRYVEMGDSLKTYTEPSVNNGPYAPFAYLQPNEQEDEWNDVQIHNPPPPIFTFSSPYSIVDQINRISNIQLNSAAMNNDNPVTIEQIQANTLAILARIGRLSSLPSTTENVQNSSNNNNAANTNITEDDEDEEVIQNPDNEYDPDSDSDSDTEWANGLMEDGEDSVS